jgi:long-subunit acyl-CoA synthetase (AMP-forming)
MATALKEEKLAFKVHDPEFNMSIEVVGICSVNREEWLVTDLACNLLNITSVPLYETLGEQMLQVIL